MEKQYNKMKRIKIEKDELLIIEAEEGFLVNAESSYGYGIGDKELRIDCYKENIQS
jgi:hypothetical protein